MDKQLLTPFVQTVDRGLLLNCFKKGGKLRIDSYLVLLCFHQHDWRQLDATLALWNQAVDGVACASGVGPVSAQENRIPIVRKTLELSENGVVVSNFHTVTATGTVLEIPARMFLVLLDRGR